MFIWTLSLKLWYRQLSKQVRFKVKSKIYFALKYNNYIKVKSNFFRFKIWSFFLYMNFYIKFSSKGGRYCLRRQYICPLHLERNRMSWYDVIGIFTLYNTKNYPVLTYTKTWDFFTLMRNQVHSFNYANFVEKWIFRNVGKTFAKVERKKENSHKFIPKPTILLVFVPCTRSMDIWKRCIFYEGLENWTIQQ